MGEYRVVLDEQPPALVAKRRDRTPIQMTPMGWFVWIVLFVAILGLLLAWDEIGGIWLDRAVTAFFTMMACLLLAVAWLYRWSAKRQKRMHAAMGPITLVFREDDWELSHRLARSIFPWSSISHIEANEQLWIIVVEPFPIRQCVPREKMSGELEAFIQSKVSNFRPCQHYPRQS